MQPSLRNFNQRTSNSLVASGRVGPLPLPRVEYVNRAGEPVNPKTGKVLQPKPGKAGSGKPYDRLGGLNTSKENGANRRWLPVKKSGILFGGLTIIPTDAKLDPPPRSCFNCWKSGHSKRDCTRPIVDRHCHNCGRRGEDVDTCPRCSRAYQIYLAKLRANERGEVLDSSAVADLLPASDEEAVDDVLRDVLYQEERARQAYEERQSAQQERHIGLSVFQDHDADSYENRNFTGQRDGTPLYQERGGTPLFQDRDDLPPRTREEPAYLDGVGYRARDKDLMYHNDEMDPQYHDRERERSREQDRERDSFYLDSERNGNGHYRSGSPSAGVSRQGYASASSASLGDPVQEILNLAKTISHLSPDTQDLIMRQVIAERKERTRQKTLQEQEADPWP